MTSIFKKLESQMTPLVAYGLIAIGIIVSFTLLSNLSDAVNDKKKLLMDAKVELATLSQLQGDDVWALRLKQSEDAKAKSDGTLWQGATAGVIAADLTQNLKRMAAGNKVAQLNIKIDPEPEMLEDVLVLHFDLRGRAGNAGDAVEFLSALSAYSRHILLQDASLSLPANQSSTLNLSGIIPIRIVKKDAS